MAALHHPLCLILTLQWSEGMAYYWQNSRTILSHPPCLVSISASLIHNINSIDRHECTVDFLSDVLFFISTSAHLHTELLQTFSAIILSYFFSYNTGTEFSSSQKLPTGHCWRFQNTPLLSTKPVSSCFFIISLWFTQRTDCGMLKTFKCWNHQAALMVILSNHARSYCWLYMSSHPVPCLKSLAQKLWWLCWVCVLFQKTNDLILHS